MTQATTDSYVPPSYTDRDREIGQELLEIIQKVRPIPDTDWFMRSRTGFPPVRLYRPTLTRAQRVSYFSKENGREIVGLCMVYSSVLHDDYPIAIPLIEEWVEYRENGRYEYRNCPMTSDFAFEKAQKLIRQYSTFTSRCEVGDHTFPSLEASKWRAMLTGERLPPAVPTDDSRRRMDLPRRCFLHYVFETRKDEIIAASKAALTGVPSGELTPEQVRELVPELIGVLTRAISQKNWRANNAETSVQLVDYLRRLTERGELV